MSNTSLVLLVTAASNAPAQGTPRLDATTRIEVDNDLLALRGGGPPPDYDYTHGTRVSFAWPTAPTWAVRTAIGQEIYTPRHDAVEPVAGDRPHAAWLYGAVGMTRLAPGRLQSLELRAGVTGPPALGESVQNGVHRLLGNHLEEGWANQLPTRLGLAADYDATTVLGGGNSDSPSRFVAGSVGATVGTLRRSIRGGASAYYGFGSALTPSADAPLVTRPGGWYVVAGYQQSLVLHDTFIEGAGGSAAAERLPWVGEAFAGTGWRSRRFSAEYRYVSRGREYRAQPERHAHGAITLAVFAR